MSTGTHLSGPFTPVVGELPGDLNGAYLCIGDHRVHRVTIEAGHARYDNRFVRTSTPRDLPAVNIVRHGGRLLALAECARPHVLDDRLDTVGPCTFDGVLPDGICAHPKIDPAAGVVRRTVVADLDVDFCRIDDRLIGRAHPVSAFAVATGAPQPRPGGRDALAWHDTRTDAVATWRSDGLAVGEPVFAPDPRSDAPDRGWWLTFTTRHSTGACALVVIPAADPARGPMAEIRMPVRGPLGQHGNWITY